MESLLGKTAGVRAERRRASRYVFDANVEIEWGSATLRGRIRDISFNGMFIEAADPLWLGARFAAQVLLDSPLRVDCVVRRIEPGRAMGVTFTAVDAESRARVASLLGNLPSK